MTNAEKPSNVCCMVKRKFFVIKPPIFHGCTWSKLHDNISFEEEKGERKKYWL